MSTRRTRMLIVLLVLCGAAVAIAGSRAGSSHAAAVAARQNLELCQRQLADLHRWRSGSDATAIQPDTSQLARLLREAADAAGAGSKLSSIEPAEPRGIGGDYSQLSVFLRLESISIKELTLFLHRLAQIDPSSRAQSIELAPAAENQAVELWNADVTIAYLSHAPGR